MVKRRRKKRDRRKFDLKRFLRDYPIVPVLACVFILGVWAGYILGQNKAEIQEALKPKLTAEFVKEQAKKIKVPEVMIPKIPIPKIPTVKPKRPKLVFVIDDVGHNKRYTELLFSINIPVTLAILPKRPYSKYFATEGRKRGFETILHQPMEPQKASDDPGAGALLVDMTAEQIADILTQNIESVPGVSGINNHMGSRATRDASVMQVVMKVLKSRGLFYLDSLTAQDSQGYSSARKAGVKTEKRDIFLDNVDTYAAVTRKINEAVGIAKATGEAIAIGHYRKNTLKAINDAAASISAQGVTVVKLKDVL